MAVEEDMEQQEYAPKKKKSDEEYEKRKKKITPGSLMKAMIRSGEGNAKPVDGDQVIFHCTIRTLDGFTVNSTRSEHGGKGYPNRYILGKSKMLLGLCEGIFTMLMGEVAMFKMKPELLYAEVDCPLTAPEDFPKDVELHYEIEILDFFKAKIVSEDMGVVKKIICEGQGWECPREPYEVEAWISAKQTDGKMILSRSSEPYFFTLGKSEIPKGLEMGIGTMSKGEKAVIFVNDSYLTKSSLVQIPESLEEVQFDVELVHFTQVRDMLGDGRLIKRRIHDGRGEFPMDCPLQDSLLRVHYKGMLLNEEKTVFYDTRVDNNGEPLEFCSGEGLVPEGFEMSVRLMLPGEISLVTCPPDYAYDKFKSLTNVPEGAYVQWEIELLGFETPKDWTGLNFQNIMDEVEKIKSTGNRLFKEGKFELAKAKYEKVLREYNHVNPQDDEEGKTFLNSRNTLHLNVAACYQKMGEYRKSIETCDKVLDANPVNAKAMYRRGMAYMLNGDFEEARKDFNPAMVDLQSPSLTSRSAVDLFGDPTGDADPLWFKKSSFLSADFDPESYIANLRSFVPLESLGSELRSHLAALKSELVELINRDYADFVSLSTRLVDVDSSIARMRAPLADFRDKVGTFRDAVENSLSSLHGGLHQRAEASAAREILERLLDTFHVVSKVEKLIKDLPTNLSIGLGTDLVHLEKGILSNENSMPPPENGANLRVTQSILLERIASEMNRIIFSLSNAKELSFIVNLEKRIQRATELLDHSLGNCFKDGLHHHDEDVIYNCLRAYAAIDNTTAAEDIFRTVIVTPLIQKIISYNQSQIIEGTSSKELEEYYKEMKQFIKSDCKFILDISSIENSGLHVFDFLANSILKEVLLAIQKGKPGAFSPGRPTEFLKNYKSSLEFLGYLEGYCYSKSAVSKFRLHAVYADFMRQWNIGVYFSLRFQEIAGALDSALMASTITRVDKLYNNQGKPQTLTLKQSVLLLESLRSCWSDDVLIISSSDKFFRLSLQLLSRYSTWLSSGLVARKAQKSDLTSSSEWATNAPAEDFIYVMNDVDYLVAELSGSYLRNVLQVLESCSTDVLDLVRRGILQAVTSLKDLLLIVKDVMVEGIAERSVEDLKQLKGITATYRMTNKLPVRHSPYVVGILRPLKTFLDGDYVVNLSKELLNELLYSTTERITCRYYEMAADVVNLARKTESSLLRLRQGAQRRAGANSDSLDSNISDTEKICMQLFLDIQEYGRNLALLGIKATDISSYRSIWQLVAPEDKQSQIHI